MEILDRIVNPWKWAALGLAAALVIALGFAGWQTLDVYSLRASLAGEQKARADEHAAAEKAARDAVEAAREVERRHAAEQEKIADAKREDDAARERLVAAARADADSLQLVVSCYASGDCGGAKAVAPAGVDWKRRSAALGVALARTDRAAGRYAEAADRWADTARALKSQIEADRAACGE